MVSLSRRRLLQGTSAGLLGGLAGCSSLLDGSPGVSADNFSNTTQKGIVLLQQGDEVIENYPFLLDAGEEQHFEDAPRHGTFTMEVVTERARTELSWDAEYGGRTVIRLTDQGIQVVYVTV